MGIHQDDRGLGIFKERVLDACESDEAGVLSEDTMFIPSLG